MKIAAGCKYNRRCFMALYRFRLFGKDDPAKRIKLFGILDLVIFVLIIIDLIAFGSDGFLWTLLLAQVILTAVFGVLIFVVPQVQYKSSAKKAGARFHYYFSEENFSIASDCEGLTDSRLIVYADLSRLAETNAFYFLFHNQLGVFAVDKKSISKDDKVLLSQTLRKKVARYLRCKY